jgi:hypothetical protein
MEPENRIADRFLYPNYLFALEGYEGFLFGRVVRRRICEYRPYPLIDSAGAAVNIPPVSHQAELRFRDPRNTANDLAYLDQTTDGGYPWFMHGAIGIKPYQVRMYVRHPEGKDIDGKFPNADPIRPSSGDSFGYIDEVISPFMDPSDRAELVIPPLQHIGAEYYNSDAIKTLNPVLNLSFAVYWADFFQVGLDDNLIGKIARREIPASYLRIGYGNNALEFGDKLLKDWKVTPIGLSEAMQ